MNSKLLLSLLIAILLSAVAFSSAKASEVKTIQVGPGYDQMITLNVSAWQKFTGSLAISGGSGNDIDFWVADPQGTIILDLERVSQGKSFEFNTQVSGDYTFHFSNTFSLISSKIVSLTYDVSIPYDDESTFTNVTLYFHNSPENNLSNNQSIYVFSGANSLQGNEVSVTQITSKTNIQFVYSGIIVWIAGISWFTGSLQTDCHLKGSADIEVWMNSVDSISLIDWSGYGAAVIDLDENNNLAWNTSISYTFGYGKIISDNPSLYEFTIDNIDHVFSKGHRIGFIIGVGSTKQAWEVNIYFDSSSMNSLAIIPVDQLIIGNESSILCIVNPLTVPLGARALQMNRIS